jgi:hypothetical protein
VEARLSALAQDGWALWEKGSRPTKKKTKTTTGRTNNLQPIRIFMHLLLFCISFPSTTGGIKRKRLDGQQKTKKEKKEKRYRNVWLDQQQHATLSPKITHGSYYTTMDDLFIYLLAQVLTV